MKQLNQAIILAGGKGTRIRTAEPSVPKALIKVTAKPILYYILNDLIENGIQKFYFSLGHMAPQIEKFVKINFPNIDCNFTVEKSPLGTGGALLSTLNQCEADDYLVVNGDTFVRYDMRAFYDFHNENQSSFSILSVFQKYPDRYGVLKLQKNKIAEFLEKTQTSAGWINAGHYLIDSRKFIEDVTEYGYNQENAFSLEALLESLVGDRQLFAFKVRSDFIDIGIPSDLQTARNSFKWEV